MMASVQPRHDRASERRVVFECVRCSRTIVVIYHTSEPRPESRDCRCGAQMGVVLLGEDVRADKTPKDRV